MLSFQKLFHAALLCFLWLQSRGQDTPLSPELERMYVDGKAYMAAGNYKDALTIFRNAASLAPNSMKLYKELGWAYYLNGDLRDADATLQKLTEGKEADEECYDLLATVQAAQHNLKGAKNTLAAGVAKFPHAGILYYEKGVLALMDSKPKAALDAWLRGIEEDPGYPENFRGAARICTEEERAPWNILFGEIYLNMTADSMGSQRVKNELFSAYKTLFEHIVKDVPDFGKPDRKKNVTTFEDAVMGVYTSLTPVVSDGITTESLTMVRTRFVMEWRKLYADRFPFSLFGYQEMLIKTGHFEVYNEWLFGKGESVSEFEAWNTFHDGDMVRFEDWKRSNKFRPIRRDFEYVAPVKE